MSNRYRNIQQKFYVTEQELALIEEKMKLVRIQNKSAYLRKSAIDGYIINVDHTDIKENTAQLQRIGGNVNQIVKRMNQTGSLYRDDVADIQKILGEIWQTQRKLLLLQKPQ